MKTLALGAVLAATVLVARSGPTDTTPFARTTQAHATPVAVVHEAAETHTLPPATLTQVVQQYCVVCHNDALMTGNVSFQTLDVDKAADRAETAERMIRKLRAGMMPPPGIPRPGGDTLVQLVETLESKVDAAYKAAPNLGDRRFQRLSQTEYQRVIKDLLELDVVASRWLPPDVFMGGFDNASGAQRLSPSLLDSFLRAASDVSLMAIGDPKAVSTSTKYKNPIQVSQHAWDHVEGTPFGTRGGIVLEHDFPADGKYVFQMTTAVGDKMVDEDFDLSIDGVSVATVMMEHKGSGVVGTLHTQPIAVKAGQHTISASFVNKIDGPYEDRFQPTAWSWAGTQGGDYGITGLTHLTEIMVTGPTDVVGVSETASRKKIFTCYPKTAAEQRPCAETIFRTLAGQAYRRPVTAQDVGDLLRFYDSAATDGGFEAGVQMGMQAMLASPEFVFRLEREPANVQPGQRYPLTDIDFATRLAFFLWDQAPDAELLKVAEAGRLQNNSVLEQQVKRMLKDPKAEALSSRFLFQWLRLQDVGKVWPENSMFPDFSKQLAEGMVKETEMLFDHIIKDDLSPLELFTADYTFVNERLAKHYGIPGVFGDEFRRVQYPTTDRRGIFGHGSVLQLTSMSARTSPVLRGKWVMEVIMGTPPPPPPPNVPAFDASPSAGAGRRLTTRERMEAHRAAPVCNSCHRFIDPIGLALDNFDAVGAFRVRENMQALDTRGEFYDGTPVTSASELSAVLMKRPVPLVRQFTNSMMAYAIGRPMQYFDQPTIRQITRTAESNGYTMSSFIMGIVTSEPFRMRQAQNTAN